MHSCRVQVVTEGFVEDRTLRERERWEAGNARETVPTSSSCLRIRSGGAHVLGAHYQSWRS